MYSMEAMTTERPTWAKEDHQTQNINVSFDKNLTKTKMQHGHVNPTQKISQPPTARSERDPPSKFSILITVTVFFIIVY